MITKDNLIDMLKKSLTNEDSFIEQYGEDFLANISKTGALKDKDRQEISNMLKSILEDTKRHAKIIKALIEKIKGGNRNEY